MSQHVDAAAVHPASRQASGGQRRNRRDEALTLKTAATPGELYVLNYMVAIVIVVEIDGRKTSPWPGERLCEEVGGI